jgi:hypothetical protein
MTLYWREMNLKRRRALDVLKKSHIDLSVLKKAEEID